MKSHVVCALSLLCGLCAFPGASHGARRALLIGNAEYGGHVLENPVKDVTAVASTLVKLGFDSTQVERNLGRQGMDEAVRKFAKSVLPDDEALIYYAGHGIEQDGVNWLLPVDFAAAVREEVPYKAYQVDQMVAAIGHVRLRLIILDACRDDPYSGGWTKSLSSRGFVPIELPKGSGIEDGGGGRGTAIVFSAGRGQLADDGKGKPLSPFAAAFVAEAEACRSFSDVVADVTARVRRTSVTRQVPQIHASIEGRVQLNARCNLPPSPADSDFDGIFDSRDQCPYQPEDKDGDRDADGCPDVDSDNDRDRIANDLDQCPADPEDHDGFEDRDGCPEGDNDRDGIKDAQDKCPDVAEDRDGCQDLDGCPEEGKVCVSREKITITEKIFFKTGKADILPKSYALLAELAKVIIENPQIELIEIQGHTDNQGPDDFNMKLSDDRANSVMMHLISIGNVAPGRLKAKGYGEDVPIGDNKTTKGRDLNRRVEFMILKQKTE